MHLSTVSPSPHGLKSGNVITVNVIINVVITIILIIIIMNTIIIVIVISLHN
jgi:hypothetical protein